MAHIKYEIVQRNGGWSIACGNVVGPPYMRRSQAIDDASWIAELLRSSGDEVEVRVQGKLLEHKRGTVLHRQTEPRSPHRQVGPQ